MSRACKIENQASRCDVQSLIKRHADNFGAITCHAKTLCHPGGTQVYKCRGCAKPFFGFEICDLRTFLSLKFCSDFFLGERFW